MGTRELEEKVAALIHDMRNDVLCLHGVLYKLRETCQERDIATLDQFDAIVTRLAGAFPDLIDALFDRAGRLQPPPS